MPVLTMQAQKRTGASSLVGLCRCVGRVSGADGRLAHGEDPPADVRDECSGARKHGRHGGLESEHRGVSREHVATWVNTCIQKLNEHTREHKDVPGFLIPKTKNRLRGIRTSVSALFDRN
jgi:hypothetical protein